jgi:hypothetical protein
MDYWARYTLALGITIVVETGLACLLQRKQAKRLVLDVPLMNLVTHPLLHLAMSFGLLLPVGELLVMGAEAIMYRTVTRLSLVTSLTLAILLNTLTWLLGYVIF